MRQARKMDLLRRRIVAVDLRPFPDGRGGRAFDPLLVLDDGSTLSFDVTETDVGAYGVRVMIDDETHSPLCRFDPCPSCEGGTP